MRPFVNHGITTVSALPRDPYPDQIVSYIADSTNGVRWLLQYRANAPGTYKWEYLGGSALFNANINAGNIIGDSAWHNASDLANSPQVTTPLVGDYEVSYSCLCAPTAAAATVYVGVGINLDSPVQVRYTSTYCVTPTAAYILSKTFTPLTTTTPTTTWTMYYQANNGAGQFTAISQRVLRVVPIRVG